MTNVLALIGLVVKLLPFLKEIFLKNKDLRDVVVNNKALLGIFLACVIMFVSNVSQFDRLVANNQQIKTLNAGLKAIEADYQITTVEVVALKESVESYKLRTHSHEIELGKLNEVVRLREERIAEMKETIAKLRER